MKKLMAVLTSIAFVVVLSLATATAQTPETEKADKKCTKTETKCTKGEKKKCAKDCEAACCAKTEEKKEKKEKK